MSQHGEGLDGGPEEPGPTPGPDLALDPSAPLGPPACVPPPLLPQTPARRSDPSPDTILNLSSLIPQTRQDSSPLDYSPGNTAAPTPFLTPAAALPPGQASRHSAAHPSSLCFHNTCSPGTPPSPSLFSLMALTISTHLLLSASSAPPTCTLNVRS